MFPSQAQVLSRVLVQNKTPTIKNDIEIYKVEELPCYSSRAIVAIGYKASNNELYIQWKKSQTTNRYYQVPERIWERFITCTESIGRLYHEVIKGNYDSTYADSLIEV